VETLLESNWDFPEICARTLFEDGHDGKLFNYKVVENFTANVLDIKFT
jgi:hypothetical protein